MAEEYKLNIFFSLFLSLTLHKRTELDLFDRVPFHFHIKHVNYFNYLTIQLRLSSNKLIKYKITNSNTSLLATLLHFHTPIRKLIRTLMSISKKFF